ncbi:hypothetical protein [Flavobacterium sp. UBA6135]|uniref:hypothetical protein n=1 Tax=Flavobacterium sp. UBA6135 TaxID=1946553 RepID=UPI0025C63420|nr:hypothetical protein [Flavobacterium sp. UBA6135]
MIIDNLISFFFGVLMTFLLQHLFGGNKEFFRIVNDFRKKLPPKDKKAIIGYNENLGMSHMNLNTLKTSLDEKELDFFLKELEDFDYSKVYFRKKKVEGYSRNLQRILKTTDWKLFGIGILQEIIDNDKKGKNKPYIFGPKIARFINC